MMGRDPRRIMFAACKALSMDDDDRHAMLMAVTGKTSSKALTPREWSSVIAHLNKLTSSPNQGAPRAWRAGCDALGGKIASLLAAQKLPWRYLTHGAGGKPSMCKRLTGADRLEFADAEGLRAIIAALSRRAAKHAASSSPLSQKGAGGDSAGGDQ